MQINPSLRRRSSNKYSRSGILKICCSLLVLIWAWGVSVALISSYFKIQTLETTLAEKLTAVVNRPGIGVTTTATADGTQTGKNSNKDMPPSCTPTQTIPSAKTRDDLAKLIQAHTNFTTAVEVGVKAGVFAENNLRHWTNCKTYKLVDVWDHQENYKDSANVDKDKQNKILEKTRRRMEPFVDKVNVEYFKMLSTEAAKLIAKESIDFIYIDARHDYCGVMEDLEAYWPLLRPGGIIAGHDYHTNYDNIGKQDWGLCQDGTRNDGAVKGAVNNFFEPKGLTISVTQEPMWMSWIVQKPLC